MSIRSRLGLTRNQAIDPTPTFSNFGSLFDYLKFNGVTYPLSFQQTLHGDKEEIGPGFPALVSQALMANTVVYACEVARVSAFSEARFQYRRMSQGRPGNLFGDQSLSVLEHPWEGAVTGDLLTRLLLNADFGGTGFVLRSKQNADSFGRLRVPRPDWITLLMGSHRQPEDPALDWDAELLALLYHPGGPGTGATPEVFLPGEFAIFAPIPDPLAKYRGIPWVSVASREISSDNAMTEHKRTFMANGATPNMVVSLDPAILQAEFDSWVDAFKASEPKGSNAYETMYLGGGAKVEVVGRDLAQLDYKSVQGGGETRIAAASGTGAIIAQLSEGMQGSSLNAGNYSAARRRFVDLTIRPLWRNVAGSLQTIVPPPGGAELWYDDRDVAFLREDAKDRAEIQSIQAGANRTLVDAGWEPDSIVAALLAEDWSLLKHSGLYSVQLQPPGTTTPEPTPTPIAPVPEPPKRDAVLLQLLDASERRATAAENRTEAPAPVFNVHASPVTVNTPEQPVTVTIERGAVEVPITVEPAHVTVNTPEVRNEITVDPTPIEVSVEPTPIEVRNDISVEPTPVAITNEVSVEPTPVSITNEIPEQRAVTKTVVRDPKGLITEIREEPTDG